MENILDLTKVPKEVLFILELLKENNDETIHESLEVFCKDIDWDLFLEYAMHHRVFPLLYSRIKILNESIVPTSVVQFLTEQYKRNTYRMLQLSVEMEQISSFLKSKGIKTLFLKGPPVAKDLYGDISLRTSTDLDFLIPIQELHIADEALLELGFYKVDTIDSLFNEWRWRSHHVAYFHPIKSLKVEVHWRLGPGPGKEASFQELWERRRDTTLTKSSVYFLGKEDLFHHLVTHGARHGWFRLRWLIDIQQSLKQKLDWNLTYRLFKSSDNTHLGGQALILVSKLLNVTITEEPTLFLKRNRANKLAQAAVFFIERMENLHPEPKSEEVREYYFKYEYSLKTVRKRVLFFLNRFLPNHLDKKTLPLPKKFYFLYFPLRPFLWIWRKFKNPIIS